MSGKDSRTAKWKEKQANRVKCDKKMDFQAHERTDKCQTDGLAESISGKEKTNKQNSNREIHRRHTDERTDRQTGKNVK